MVYLIVSGLLGLTLTIGGMALLKGKESKIEHLKETQPKKKKFI